MGIDIITQTALLKFLRGWSILHSKILLGKLEEKMGGAITTGLVFIVMLLMVGAFGFLFGHFN